MYLSVLKANIYKYFITLFRAYPRSFFIGGILTITYSLLFSYLLYTSVFNGQLSENFIASTNTANYMGYIVIGVLVYSFTVSTLLNVSRSLITERRLGTLESVMLAPYNRGMYFLAYMLAQTFHTLGELVFAFPILLVFGVHFSPFNFGSFMLIFALALFAFLGLSLLLANIMLYTRDTYISQNTLFNLMFLICGVNFPITYLPKWVQNISFFLPVTHVIKLFREVILSNESLLLHTNEILYLFVQGVVYIFLGFLLLGRIEKIALEKIDG